MSGISDNMNERLLINIRKLYNFLNTQMKQRYNRHVSFGDLFTNRQETAQQYGFGKGTSCYDNVLILGNVTVGKNTWIGPNVILDGSGGLEIGDFCSISAGVQIYTHNTVKWSNSLGDEGIEKSLTKIGSGVYVGPNSIIQMGVNIGDRVTIGALSLVNCDIPSDTKAWGIPTRIQKR